MFSNACAYGLRATIYLARCPADSFVAIEAIAEAVGAPKAFLRKVMRRLARAGFVHALRGAGGGVRLARAPNTIAMFDIALALDGDKRFNRCMLHLSGCSSAAPCPFHTEWESERTRFESV